MPEQAVQNVPASVEGEVARKGLDAAEVARPPGRGEQRDLWDAYREHVHRFPSPALLEGSKQLHVVIDASKELG